MALDLSAKIYPNVIGKTRPEYLLNCCYQISDKIFILGYDRRFEPRCLVMDLGKKGGEKYLEMRADEFRHFCYAHATAVAVYKLSMSGLGRVGDTLRVKFFKYRAVLLCSLRELSSGVGITFSSRDMPKLSIELEKMLEIMMSLCAQKQAACENYESYVKASAMTTAGGDSYLRLHTQTHFAQGNFNRADNQMTLDFSRLFLDIGSYLSTRVARDVLRYQEAAALERAARKSEEEENNARAVRFVEEDRDDEWDNLWLSGCLHWRLFFIIWSSLRLS